MKSSLVRKERHLERIKVAKSQLVNATICTSICMLNVGKKQNLHCLLEVHFY